MAKLIVANWKANPKTPREALKLAKASDFKNAVIAPPFIYLQALSPVLKKAALGAQDAFWEMRGPYTGEITPIQIKNLKAKYVIIGHSERRQLGETDTVINKKIKAVLKAGLKVILCVGENRDTRRKGITSAKRFVGSQLKKDLAGIRTSHFTLRNPLIIAYEPVWAIGTGKSDKPKDSVEIIKDIKKLLDSRCQIPAPVLYGGSVTSGNAKSFLSQPEIDGALVGGASLKLKEFKTIIKTGNSL